MSIATFADISIGANPPQGQKGLNRLGEASRNGQPHSHTVFARIAPIRTSAHEFDTIGGRNELNCVSAVSLESRHCDQHLIWPAPTALNSGDDATRLNRKVHHASVTDIISSSV